MVVLVAVPCELAVYHVQDQNRGLVCRNGIASCAMQDSISAYPSPPRRTTRKRHGCSFMLLGAQRAASSTRRSSSSVTSRPLNARGLKRAPMMGCRGSALRSFTAKSGALIVGMSAEQQADLRLVQPRMRSSTSFISEASAVVNFFTRSRMFSLFSSSILANRSIPFGLIVHTPRGGPLRSARAPPVPWRSICR